MLVVLCSIISSMKRLFGSESCVLVVQLILIVLCFIISIMKPLLGFESFVLVV